MFSGASSEKYVDFSFTLLGNKVDTSGLIDSGNILKDPMNMLPVIIMKSGVVSEYIADTSINGAYSLPEELKRLVRLIPAKGLGTEKMLLGIRCDIVIKADKANHYTKSAVIAFDNEKGSFGGYTALVPSELVVE